MRRPVADIAIMERNPQTPPEGLVMITAAETARAQYIIEAQKRRESVVERISAVENQVRRLNSDRALQAAKRGFAIALCTLMIIALGAFVWTVRNDDLSKLRQSAYNSCQVRNTNLEATKAALLELAVDTSTSTQTASDVTVLAERLKISDCSPYAAR